MFDAKSLLDSLMEGVSEIGDQLKAAKPGEIASDVGEKASDVLGQATSGVKEVAGKAMDATGAGDAIEDLVGKVSGGQSTEELLAKAKDFVGDKKVEAGILAGGLAALLLGSKRGRKVTKKAAAVGGAALIGGLAYKAFQNFQQDKPLFSSDDAPEAAPSDSGFTTDELSDAQAQILVQAMVAAAASDQKIDETERMRLTLGLKEAGLETEAADFLEQQLQNPISFDDLAEGVDTPEFASQVYTAARLAIEPDTDAEKSFLQDLADSLTLSEDMVAHLDAAASAAKAA